MYSNLPAIVLALCVSSVVFASASNECGSKTTNVRLQGGQSGLTGRVEVCIDGEWKTMCAQRFNNMDATVVCRELGFSDKGARVLHSGFKRSQNDGPTIWLQDTLCKGHEESLLNCSTRALRSESAFCINNKVGVACKQPQVGELRILGGVNSSAGRLEIFVNNAWGTICDDYWSRSDAQVACKQLFGSSAGAQSVRNGFRKRDVTDITPIWLDNLLCKGTERSLLDCRHNGVGIHNCRHNEDAGIICEKTSGERSMVLRRMRKKSSVLQRLLQKFFIS